MTAVEARPRGLWSYVFRLLRLQVLIFFTGFKRARMRRKIGTIVLALLALGALVGSFFLARFLVGLMRNPALAAAGLDVTAFVKDIPVLIVSAAFTLILFTSFGLLLQALYLANDMDFLLSAPIPIRAVFLAKLLQAILPNFALILLIGLPVLYGLAAANGYNVLYYPLVLVVLASLSLAAAGISGLLVMAVARVFPARRVAEVLGMISAILVIVSSQWSNLRGNQDITPEQMLQGTRALSGLNSPWSPLAWGGRGLVDLGEGRWLPGLFFLALALVSSGLVFWVALNAAEKLYYSGWASMQVGTRRRNRTPRGNGRLETAAGGDALLRRLVPAQVRAMMHKDSLQLRRDLRNLSQLISPMIMGVVFGIMLLRSGGEPPPGRGEAPAAFIEAFRLFLAYGSVAISLFVGWTLLSRLALISFSMERSSYWILKSAPVSAGRLLAAKFLVAYLPALVQGWIFLFAISLLQKVPTAIILYGLPSIALILAGLDGINLAFGVRSANFNWTDPRRMAGGAAGCLSMVASVAYLGLSVLMFFGPPIGAPLLGISEGIGRMVGLLAGSITALLCTVLPLRLVKERVHLLGEE